MPWANPPNFDWSRWGEKKKRTVSVQGGARKATDSGGDEEKDSAPDRQQLDPPAQQQQCLQGAHLCRGPPEEVGVTRGGGGSTVPQTAALLLCLLYLTAVRLLPYLSCFLSCFFFSCRFESLDNLDTLRQSSHSSTMFSYPRPHSAAGYCAPSRNSSSRYSTGAILPQRIASVDPSPQGRYGVGAEL